MIEVVDFKKEHLEELLKVERNQKFKKLFGIPNYDVLAKPGMSYSILCATTKRILFCCGIIPFWNGRGECWAFFGDNVKRHMVQIHKAVARGFEYELTRYTRIEAVVELDHKPGHRWMKSLGFRLEAPVMQKYWPDGSDNSLYAKVR